MSKVVFSQRVEVIETYQFEYEEEEFLADCKFYGIHNLSYEELCDILELQLEVFITVYDFDNREDSMPSPRLVDAYEFFLEVLSNHIDIEEPLESEFCSVLSQELQVDRHNPIH